MWAEEDFLSHTGKQSDVNRRSKKETVMQHTKHFFSFPFFSSLPAIFTLTAAFLFTGCTQCSDEKNAETSETENAAATVSSEATPQEANVTEEKSSEDDSVKNDVKTLQIVDEKIGTGAEAVDGKTVSVFYTGTLVDGTKFDSSKDRATPFSFVLGSGMVISGWDQGIKGMREGGIRKLTIPPDLAYGDRGAGGLIPPNSVLIFEVELLKVE
jgi:FKBP-type peptidyl-prolyl cis-trans isomerase